MNPIIVFRLACFYRRKGMTWRNALRESYRNNQRSRSF